MAKELYNGELNSFMDFGAVEYEGKILPASGLAVQNYIKDKIGFGYFDAETSQYLFFADEDTCNEYLEHHDPDLILSRIQLESIYSLRLNVIEPETVYTPIFYGSIGNYIKFDFETVNKDGQLVYENIDVVYNIECGGSVINVNESYVAGATAIFNIDNYLKEGVNTVTITAKGQTTKVSNTTSITFDVINLSLTDNFDITDVYTNQDTLLVTFTYAGTGIKYVEWYLDGETYSSVDSYIDYEGNGYKQISLAELTPGKHNLQYRLYVETSGGTKFYTDTLYRDFVINDDLFNDTVILTKFSIPRTSGIIENPFADTLPLNGPVQYEEYFLVYSIFSKSNKNSYTMNITFDSDTTSYNIKNQTEYEYIIRSYEDGEFSLVLECEYSTLNFLTNIETTSYNLHPISEQLITFKFSGSDKTNDSYNREQWDYKNWTGQLSGFNWNENSGWSNGRLVIPDGASFITNYAPFANDIKNTGFTFEIEFETNKVTVEDTPILDLRGDDDSGLLITTSQISFTTSSTTTGTTLSTRYKPEENIRLGLVINPQNIGVHPKMMFIYVDGILTGAAEYQESDSFISNKVIKFIGTDSATVRVKQICTYPLPLTRNQILDNFILYQDSVEDLVNTYDRNNIYVENTQRVSDTKLASRTPIIVITGNVNKLQNFTEEDKGTYVKMDKIEIINFEDPTKNMTLIDASMRCQGTSSMAYPRKNFRFYTQKDWADKTVPEYTTRMFDWEGRELLGKNRIYSFKEKAQQVNCWCLKADYAESSSTHNTGVARMWNDYMKNVRMNVDDVDDRFYLKETFAQEGSATMTPCKTMAQFVAERGGYGFDVRTTVDGYPISLFFHEKESDPLTFLGRYNWNNDKSTESVYGFKGIPGFDNSHMECWEVVNGDKVCNLFTDVSEWDNGEGLVNGWYDSFEARYPDDHDKPSETERATGPDSALKRVAFWINRTMGASKVDDDPESPTYNKMIVDDQELMDTFSSEKWNYLDVYKIAAYYIYLMRFGAVDQTVKNAMFTTEDGLHWYYINYDNDTINGVRNDGALKFGYDIDRQSKDPDSEDAWCYAGHASVLWNNLEADAEFMEIVKKIDRALYDAGMSYASVIDMFNNKQSAMWAERTHNEDYDYKYINISDKKQLVKLQGPRKSHRQWWLSHRFAIYDALNGAGGYRSNKVAIKPLAGPLGSNEYVTVVPAVNGQIFGYGYQNPVGEPVYGQKDVPIQFPMIEDYYIGTTIDFYNAVYIKTLDISKISQHVQEITLNLVNTEAFDSSLTNLILGDENSQPNTSMTSLPGLDNIKYLETFKMNKYNAIGSVDLSNNNYIKSVDVRYCNYLTSVQLPQAAPLENLYLPTSIRELRLHDFSQLNVVEIQADAANVRTIDVSGCPQFTDTPTFLINWITNKITPDAGCIVHMEDIYWTDDVIDVNQLRTIANFALSANSQNPENVMLSGRAYLSSLGETEEEINENIELFRSAFGDNVFESTASFYIYAPPQVILVGPNTVLEGDSVQYTNILIGQEGGVSIYSIARTGGNHDEYINPNTGLLTTTETGEGIATISVSSIYTPPTGTTVTNRMIASVLPRVYPTSGGTTISGNHEMTPGQSNTFTVNFDNESEINGEMIDVWSVSGDIEPYVRIVSHTIHECVLELDASASSQVILPGVLSLTLKKKNVSGQPVIFTKTYNIVYKNNDIAVAAATNPHAMRVLYNNLHSKGKCEHSEYMTKNEAISVTNEDLMKTSSSSIFSIDNQFRIGCTSFDEFQYFLGVTSLSQTFNGCTALTSVVLPVTISVIGVNTFYNCSSLVNVNIPNGVIEIGNAAFYRCAFSSITIPNGLNGTMTFGPNAFSYNNNLTTVNIACNIPLYCFSLNYSSSPFNNCNSLTNINLLEGVVTIGNYAFYNRADLTSITIPNSVTTIGDYAFSSCTSLTSITIPDSVTSINIGAFSGCTSLTSITIPDSVTSIGRSAFSGCSGLIDVNISGDIPYQFMDATNTSSPFYNATNIAHIVLNNTIIIGVASFFGRTNLTSITIPDSVTSIGNQAFQNCTSLTSITIPDGVTSIGTSVFYNCTSLNEVIIGSGVTSILGSAFQNCTSLASITIPDSVTTIGYQAFQDCTSLTNITIPDSVTTIGASAFQGCISLENIKVDDDNQYFNDGNGSDCIIQTSNNTLIIGCKNTIIPNSVTTIGNYAFSSCTSLTGITIPNSVTTINIGAFYNCTGLTSITIPNSVTTISGNAFIGCIGLENIEVDDDNQYFNDGNGSDCIIQTSNNTLIIGCKNTIIPNSVTTIGDQAFQNCTGLTSITIPDSVITIGSQAFYGCTSLNELIIGSGVTSIGNQAFSGCTSLTSITIPDSVTSIGINAFYGCTSLTSITIPDSVTTIGDQAFSGCTSLTSITIPGSVTTIGRGVFIDCISLNEVIIGSGVTSIGNQTFYGCTSLTSITIPDNVTTIGDHAFYNCTSLTEAIIGNGVTTIGDQAFYSCTSLTSITIPDSVTTIRSQAFRNCTSINEVIIGSGVTSIGTSAFYNCTGLKTITCLPTTPPTISSNTLPGTNIVDNIYVPSTSVSAYQGASNWNAYASKISAIQ